MPIPCAGLARPVEGQPGLHADLLEGAVAAVMEDEVLHAVVGNDDVRKTVVVQIDERDAQALATGSPVAGLKTSIPADFDTSRKRPRPSL